jgi:hypothetical protein
MKMADNGNCAWPNCKKTGSKWLQGKCYCEKHYDGAMAVANNKPALKAAMGATTVVNEH